jgi:DNA polymerase III sliding clamp (beta) subunit (PCNA family)
MDKVSFKAGEIRQAIKYAEKAIPSTPGLLAFSALNFIINLNELTVIGSDGDITNSTKIKVEASNKFSFLLPPKPILGYLATIPDDEDITLIYNENEDVELSRKDTAKYLLRPLSTTYPPAIVANSPEQSLILDDLEGIVKAIKPSTGKENQSILIESKIDSISFCSTDGYRLTKVEVRGQSFGEAKLHLPLKVLENLSKISVNKVQIDTKNDIIRFSSDSASVTARQIATPHQNVDNIVSKHVDFTYEAVLNKDQIIPALNRLLAVSEGEPLVCEIKKDQMTLSVSNISLGSGSENITLTHSNCDELKFGVSLTYLKDAVSAHTSSDIKIKLNSPLDPIFLLSESSKPVLSIVMPVKINN